MAVFEVKIIGLEELQAKFKRYPKISEPILQRAINASHATLAKHTLKFDPVPYKTGALLQSFRFETGRLWARWRPTVKYAAAVNDGYAAHVIVPRNKPILAWRGNGTGGKYVTSRSGRQYYKQGSAGDWIVARRVNHPGYKGAHYMERIIESSQKEIDELIGSALNIITEEIAK